MIIPVQEFYTNSYWLGVFAEYSGKVEMPRSTSQGLGLWGVSVGHLQWRCEIELSQPQPSNNQLYNTVKSPYLFSQCYFWAWLYFRSFLPGGVEGSRVIVDANNTKLNGMKVLASGEFDPKLFSGSHAGISWKGWTLPTTTYAALVLRLWVTWMFAYMFDVHSDVVPPMQNSRWTFDWYGRTTWPKASRQFLHLYCIFETGSLVSSLSCVSLLSSRHLKIHLFANQLAESSLSSASLHLPTHCTNLVITLLLLLLLLLYGNVINFAVLCVCS